MFVRDFCFRSLSLVCVGSLAAACSSSLLAAPDPGHALGAEEDEAPVGASGGVLHEEQAAYDVLHYGLDLRVDPEAKRIDGRLLLRAAMTEREDASQAIRLHLDPRLSVEKVVGGDRELSFTHDDGVVRIDDRSFLGGFGEADVFELVVHYGGTPRVAPRPPWNGGFTWAETADGSPWIATSCQGEGADLWWPCKDHPSDEADSMSINVTVPDPLVVATNGRFVAKEAEEDGWTTWRWHVSTPINNYGVALNIAPYREIRRDFESTAGDVFPVSYWVLPENYEKGQVLYEEIVKHLHWFETVYGPYPFRGDKYGVAETPHLGMEHQTIIAYGNEYRGNIWGPKKWNFDSLHHHELAHEWWANLVTARSWEDMWIHEGFGTYAQALYVEHLHGEDAYHEQMAYYDRRHGNKGPVAPRRTMDTKEVYFGSRGDSPGGDIYNKGACVLHSLRWLVGKDTLLKTLRRIAYPDPALEKTTDGSACRFSDTDEVLAIAETHTGRELDWFFDVYLRQPKLPVLRHEVEGDTLAVWWEVPDDLPFPMPVELVLDGDAQRLEMPATGRVTVALEGRSFELDPKRKLLRAKPRKKKREGSSR